MLAAYCTTAQAALLDVGPTVPQVIGSTAPVGHGFPSWYRDTNRLALEPCMNEAMCFFAPPDPAFPVSFPGNIPDEMFYYAAEADIPLASGGSAILVQALEAAYSTGNVVPGAQITFARMRIRVDTNVAGTYVVTTPYKQYTFNNVLPGIGGVGARGINITEDVGITTDGVFTGALAGAIGPFLHCTAAPIIGPDGGSYIGYNVTPCPVTGSTFVPPGQTLPANYFRIQGPPGFGGALNGIVETTDFRVQGKIYTTPTPTPLTVDRATYTRDAVTTQVDVFATTQPISNQTAGTILKPTLANIPSTLTFTDNTAVIVPNTSMQTNVAKDGKFFGASNSFATPATLPATVRVTNTADVPPTTADAPLVDAVVISTATYDPFTSRLRIVAASGDRLAPAPTLTVIMKDGTQDVVLGTIANGRGELQVTFPLLKTLPLPIGAKTYNIPPESVTVTSAKGGSDTVQVTSPLNNPPVAANDTAVVSPGGSVIIPVAANDSDPDTGDAVVPTTVKIVTPPSGTLGTAVNNFDGTITYKAQLGASGNDTFTYTINDTFGAVSNAATVTVTIHAAPVASAIAVTTNEDTAVSVAAAAGAIASPPAAIALNTVLITAPPLHGTAVALAVGTIQYTPNLNYNGPDSFSYTVKDNLGAVSLPAVVSITVTPVADPPLALNDTATTQQDTPVTINVLANDSHPDAPARAIDPLSLLFTQPVVGGTVSAAAGAGIGLQFTPAAGFIGTASFTYTVSDNAVPPLSSTATVTVNVTATPANKPPVAANDVASTFVGTPRTINVLANDTDADGTINPASVVIGALPANVTAVAGATGTVTFTATVAGTYTFTYTVKDNLGAVSLPATVTVSVTSPITDSVSILKAEFVASQNQWNVEGNTANLTTLPRTVTLRIGSGLTGNIIGTATVATDGRWRFQSNVTGVVANAANSTISAFLPSGASRLAFPVAIK